VIWVPAFAGMSGIIQFIPCKLNLIYAAAAPRPRTASIIDDSTTLASP